MAKITLTEPLSGYNLAAINANFVAIEQEFQDKVLYRNNPVGEANNLETDIDANSKRIYNLPAPSLPSEAARLQDVQNALANNAANLITFAPAVGIAATNVQAAIEEVVSDLSAPSGSSLVAYQPAGTGAVATTTQAKLRETISVTDRSTVQAAVDSREAIFQATNYIITTPVKFSSLSRTVGKRAGTSFIGSTAFSDSSLSKAGNQTVVITDPTDAGNTVTVDCIGYLDPTWSFAGATYPQKMTIEALTFKGDAATPNTVGFYVLQGGGFIFRDLDIYNTVNAMWFKDAWLTIMDRVHAESSFVVQNGTSFTMNNCWTGAGNGSPGGYNLAGLKYSTMNSCASDGATNGAYRFVNSLLTLNSCGCEASSVISADSGTAISFDGGNEIVLNNFNIANTLLAPIFAVGASNVITFNQGSSYLLTGFPTATDIRVWGANSTVIFNDYTFANGSKDNPNIVFAVGTSSSKVIVNYGQNQKIYTTDGAGATLVEKTNDSGVWSPTATAAAGTITSYTSYGTWVKTGKIVTLTGSLVITNNGTGSIQGFIGGVPSDLAVFGGVNNAVCGSYREGTTSGALCALFKLTTTTFASTKYDGTYPWATGSTIDFTVTYQID